MTTLTLDPTDRNDAIKIIRAELKRRSGKTWSVTGGTGSAWGWILVMSPPARRVRNTEQPAGSGVYVEVVEKNGYSMSNADQAELTALLGEPVHHQGTRIPASGDYRLEYVARAKGEAPTIYGQRYWD